MYSYVTEFRRQGVKKAAEAAFLSVLGLQPNKILREQLLNQ
jgi:hypothetical protein